MVTIDEMRARLAAFSGEATAAQAALKEADERADLEAQIVAAQEQIRAARCASVWTRLKPLLEAKGHRLARIAVGRGETYGEVFFRQASEAEIKARPDTDAGTREWAAKLVVWIPPSGEGETKPEGVMSYIDSHMALYPGTWAHLVGALVSHSVETAEIVRGKA